MHQSLQSRKELQSPNQQQHRPHQQHRRRRQHPNQLPPPDPGRRRASKRLKLRPGRRLRREGEQLQHSKRRQREDFRLHPRRAVRQGLGLLAPVLQRPPLLGLEPLLLALDSGLQGLDPLPLALDLAQALEELHFSPSIRPAPPPPPHPPPPPPALLLLLVWHLLQNQPLLASVLRPVVPPPLGRPSVHPVPHPRSPLLHLEGSVCRRQLTRHQPQKKIPRLTSQRLPRLRHLLA
mmetsp:Transcript_14670/g.50089  ORF Transcript_14670/g.50089 Transcript_14670/m.50089 type:complete len:235 (-) Transcript_14670:426-1130(-)